MATLISDGGTMTVGRKTASYTYGSFEVVLPDGLQQEETDTRIADAYIYRPDDIGTGRAELTFVRADARIDMNHIRSDLESTLETAARRVEGNVFYTREIFGKGLGRTKPGKDYDIGSVVDVLVWGKRIALPVTGLSTKSNPELGHHFAVQVGGQALTDAEKLRKINSDLDNQIAAEKRQRLKEVGLLDQKAQQAQNTADEAVEEATELRGVLAGEGASRETLNAQLIALNEQLQEAGESPDDVAFLGLLPAYMEANTRRWELQEKVDQMQNEFASELQEQIEQTKQAILDSQRGKIQKIIATTAGTSHPDVPATLQADGRYQVAPPGTENALVIWSWWTANGADLTLTRQMQIKNPGGAVAIVAPGETLIGEWAQVPGQMKTISLNESDIKWLNSSSTWYRVAGPWTIGSSGTKDFDLSGTLRFRRAWGFYRLQVMAGSTVLFDKEYRGSSTITSYVNKTVSFTVKSKTIPPNTEVSVRVIRWDNGPFSEANSIDNLVVRGSWVETS